VPEDCSMSEKNKQCLWKEKAMNLNLSVIHIQCILHQKRKMRKNNNIRWYGNSLTHQKQQKNDKRVILATITLTKCQCAAE